MSTNEAAAVGILQAAILAMTFWLAGAQYWLQQNYEEGDERFRVTSVLLGTGNSIGIFSLLLAVRFSSDALLESTGGDVETAIRLIDLFTFVVFGMLVGMMGDKMVADDHPKLALKYTLTFSVLAPLTIGLYLFGFVWIILGVVVLSLISIFLYLGMIRPKIVAQTREETEKIYPEVMANGIATSYQLFRREEFGPLSRDDERRIRKMLEKWGVTDEGIAATLTHLRDRCGVERESIVNSWPGRRRHSKSIRKRRRRGNRFNESER